MNHNAPKKTELLHYSFLSLPLAFAGLPLYINAPDFYIRELGISIGMIGIALVFIRLFDAIQDPFIGYISDIYSDKRSILISVGVAILSLGMGGIFFGPHFNIYPVFWFSLFMLLATTGFSICSININQIGGFWKEEPTLRTLISAWREGFTLIGLLTAAILPTILQQYYETEFSFQLLFCIFFIFIMIAYVLFIRFLFDTTLSTTTKIKSSIDFQFINLFKGANSLFFSVCFLSQLASSMPAILVLFFIRDYLGLNEFIGFYLFLYFSSAIVFLPLWVNLSKKFGKLTIWLSSMILSVIVFSYTYTLAPGDAFEYSVICLLSGVMLGADLVLPPAILADRISQQKSKAISTQYFAALGFIPKLTISIASGLTFIILDYVGFKADSLNSEYSLTNLLILYSLLPCLIKLVAAMCLFFLQRTEGYTYAQYERGHFYDNTHTS